MNCRINAKLKIAKQIHKEMVIYYIVVIIVDIVMVMMDDENL